ncbi:MAG TPA: hypothetical protein VFW86_02035, partial [Candidatus Limnocylindrales bacterium]|nr:hypothetical protein [Candidatus Limnocylindrales bacterium]
SRISTRPGPISRLIPLQLRDVPGLPDPNLQPPQVAERGDPFAALRVVDLLARIPRGQPVRLRDIVERLNADYLDWSFDRGVVADTIIQLQANWIADYRTVEGIAVGEDPAGETVTIEDTSRVDPWFVHQAERLAADCHVRLRAFAVEAGAIP